jgi:hypothetical protein
MSVTYRVVRNEDEATLFASGALVATAGAELFDQIVHLLDQGYHTNVDLKDADFVGLGAVRALQTATVRAEKAGVELRLSYGPAVYRIADLVGAERWSPLPKVSFEDDSVAV